MALTDLPDATFEFFDSLLPISQCRWRIREKQTQDVNEVFWFGEASVVKPLTALIEHGAVGLPKQDVFFWITYSKFLFDFLIEIIMFVLGFPQSVVQAEVVEQASSFAPFMEPMRLRSVLRKITTVWFCVSSEPPA